MYSQQRSFLIIHQEAIDRYRRSEGYTTDEMRLPSNTTLRLLWKLFEYPDTTDDVTMETCYYCHQLTVSVLFFTVFNCLKNLFVFLVDLFARMTVCVCTELYVLLPLWRNKT